MSRLVVLLACAAALWWLEPPAWERFPLPSGVEARVRRVEGPGWVVVLQGYHLPPHFVDDAAHEFARRGFSVATLDLNRAPKPAVPLAELLQHLDGDVFFYAHSGSVTPAVQVASQHPARVAASVLLGFYPPRGTPRNVLLAFGRFDDYISPSEMLDALDETGGPRPTAPGVTAGQFPQGTARRLEISPLSHHGGEPFDPVLQQAAARWFGASGAGGVPFGLLSLGTLLAGWCAGSVLPRHWGSVLGCAGVALFLQAAAGVAALGALAVRSLPAGSRSQLLRVWLALNAGVIAGRPEAFQAVFLYEFLYLPSQATGWLRYYRETWEWPLLAGVACLGFATWLGPRAESWLRRWEKASLALWLWAVPAGLLALGLRGPAAGVAVYLLSGLFQGRRVPSRGTDLEGTVAP